MPQRGLDTLHLVRGALTLVRRGRSPLERYAPFTEDVRNAAGADGIALGFAIGDDILVLDLFSEHVLHVIHYPSSERIIQPLAAAGNQNKTQAAFLSIRLSLCFICIKPDEFIDDNARS